MKEFNIYKYYDLTCYSNNVLNVVYKDVQSLNDPFDINVTYGGRGDSRSFHLSELLVPEFTDNINWICWLHDKIYNLIENKIDGYTKEFADSLFYELLKAEDFPLAYVYYLAVVEFG